MSQARRTLERIAAMLEGQGAERGKDTRGNGGSIRMKCPSGAVITMHGTPRSNDNQVRQIRQQVKRAGLEWTLPEKL